MTALFHKKAAAAFQAQQDLKGIFPGLIVHHLPAVLGVQQHPLYLEISAPAKQLRRAAFFVFQSTHGLTRFVAAQKINHISGFFDVELARSAVFVSPTIVVQAVSDIGASLDFRHQCARAQARGRFRLL